MKRVLFIFCFYIISACAYCGEKLTYEVAGNQYEGYLALASESKLTILLIHDWDGLTDYEVKRANMLAKVGYNVFALDLFGKGLRPTAIEDKRKMTSALYSNREKMRQLMMGALAFIRTKGLKPTTGVVMGYCFGGAATLELARSGIDMKAFVSFHGGLKTPEGQSYSNTKGHVVIFHGSADRSVSMADFSTLAESLEMASVPHEMITYSAAPHAFTVFGSERYREDADKKSWNRFINLLSEL